MNFVRIDPPGTWCMKAALRDVVKKLNVKTFFEVGVGRGELAFELCQLGLTGTGCDISERAIAETKLRNEKFIVNGALKVEQKNFFEQKGDGNLYDLTLSAMVVEHVTDDNLFTKQMAAKTAPGGFVMIMAPGRKKKWGIEDELVGHIRRYDVDDLKNLLKKAGLKNIKVISVAVPVANLLLAFSNLIYKIKMKGKLSSLTKQQQTEASGSLEIPFKTVFPSWVRVILNKYTMAPILFLQKLFYNTSCGLVLLGYGEKPNV